MLGLKQPQHADELLSEMLDVELPEVSPRSYSRRILGLMRRHGATFYDAGYHALAIERSGVMVTADRRHIAKCGRMGHLRFIGDWPLPR